MAPVELHEAARRLARLGLSDEEAAVYVQLCGMGPAKASDVARRAKLPRARAYRVLQRLEARGFVDTMMQNPTRYVGKAPDEVFGLLAAELDARRAEVERTRTEVAPVLEGVRDGRRGAEVPKTMFRVIEGVDEATRVLERLVLGAKQEVLAVGIGADDASAGAVAADLSPALVRRLMEGLSIRAILSPEAGFLDRIRPVLAMPNMQFRSLERPERVRFFVSDRTTLLAVMATPGASGAEQEVRFLTNAPDFVGAQVLFFEELWRRAEPEAHAKESQAVGAV